MPKKSTKRSSRRTKKSKLTEAFQVINRNGLHARAASLFVKTAQQFDCVVTLRKDGMEVSGKSILGIMMLGAPFGSTIEMELRGADAAKASKHLGKLIRNGFDHV